MPDKVLCVGRNSLDLVFSVDLAAIQAEGKQRTAVQVLLAGVQCVNAAVTLAGLG